MLYSTPYSNQPTVLKPEGLNVFIFIQWSFFDLHAIKQTSRTSRNTCNVVLLDEVNDLYSENII